MQWDSTYAEMVNGFNPFAACSSEPVYTRARTCQTLTICGETAIEVIAPTTPTGPCSPSADNTGPDCNYIGDRYCQCPDYGYQTDHLGRNPFDLTAPIATETAIAIAIGESATATVSESGKASARASAKARE